jgi:hypothetical protein
MTMVQRLSPLMVLTGLTMPVGRLAPGTITNR